MGKKKQAIAYLRVSTSGQAEAGAGLDLQRIRIDTFAREAGFAIAHAFSDAQSGVGEDSAAKRPGLRDAVALSIETGWPILVDGLDRFSRNTRKLEAMVLDGRLEVISTKSGESPARAVVIAEAQRAQAEAERISRTTKEGLQKARARGVTLGNTKNLDEARQLGIASNKSKAERMTRGLMPIVQEIRAGGKATKAQIADELNRRGYRSPRGAPWTATTIRPQLERIAGWESASDANSDNPLYGMF
ncbi:MAG: recombinase family protein [Aurantimonas endophytica]|uniref:recombinase family protein n=1 Tax=Aurantimonas endophytica TaxID=1522175 RepID=UPI003002CDE8